jgi:hypothetical protein
MLSALYNIGFMTRQAVHAHSNSIELGPVGLKRNSTSALAGATQYRGWGNGLHQAAVWNLLSML